MIDLQKQIDALVAEADDQIAMTIKWGFNVASIEREILRLKSESHRLRNEAQRLQNQLDAAERGIEL